MSNNPNAGGVSKRKAGEHMSEWEREDLAQQAYEMALEKHSYAAIARELQCNRKTIKIMVSEKHAENHARHLDRLSAQVATYEIVARKAFETYAALVQQGNTTAQNRVATLNAATNALTRIDMLLGLEAPKKTDVTQRTAETDFTNLPSDVLEAIIAKEQEIRELADGTHGISAGDIEPGDIIDG